MLTNITKHRLASIAAFLPAVVFVGAATGLHTMEQRSERLEFMAEQARLSAAAIDLRLERLLNLTSYCATSPAIISRMDPAIFQESCGRYAEMLGAWVVVVALGETHQQVINTRPDAPPVLPSYPRGDEHATLLDVEERSRITGRPEVANIFKGKIYTDSILSTGQWIMLSDGREAMLYVGIPASSISEQLMELAGNGETVFALVDPSQRIVARSVDIERLMFAPVPFWFVSDLEAGQSGANLGMPGPENIGGTWDTGYHPLSTGSDWLAVAVQPVTAGFTPWDFVSLANLLVFFGLALSAMQLGFNAYYNWTSDQLRMFKQAQREAEQRSKEKSLVLASFAHDVRSPLVGLVGSLAVMEEKGTTDRADIRTARVSAEALLQLVDDILELSFLGSGKFKLQSSPVDLRRLIDDLAAQTRILALRKGLTVNIEVDRMVPPAVEIDRLRLQQVLGNLLSNAVKYTETGSVMLRVLSGSEQDGKIDLTFVVADTGVGISKEDEDQVFREFGRLDRPIERRESGTGLGLAICKRILTVMGSKLHLESAVGKGSIFSFRLTAPVFQGAALSLSAKPLSGVTILYAEDEAIIRSVTSRQLTDAGANVIEAEDGVDALEKLRDVSPDLFLVDIQMPRLDGVDAIRRLREQSPERHYPIFVLTSHISGAKAAEARAEGADEVFTKPVQILPLAAALLAQRGDRGNHTPQMGGANEDDEESIVELERLRLLVRGDPTQFREIHLPDFERRMRHDLSLLMNHIAAGALPEAQRLSHRCLGVCLVLGATALAKQLKEIEQEAQVGDPADVTSISEGVEALAERTFLTMRHITDEISNKSGDGTAA
jgi:signal transduction histidine kinase/CheY-like chemotaxis protein/HPt (histidine-containing phosphotransfer) domain-containing protein